MSKTIRILLLLLIIALNGKSQSSKNAAEIKSGLERLSVLGSVLYFAAHPDDENTRLISWLANEKKYRTSYLSLTRGDGGQNLIGNQLGIELGLIRTQELLAARRIDGGEQYFSSAYDFGFSKTYEETFQFWNKQETLREAVYIIRKLRPDIIINRFPPDPRGGHGHHQASAILSKEAFEAAGDPTQFPEQLQEVDVWQAKRLLWNTANFGGQNNTSDEQLQIQIGQFNALLGTSYGEMAAHSRSQHKSQGFGSAPMRGNAIEYFEHVAGDPAKTTLLDGVITNWNRIENTTEIQALIDHINRDFDYTAPQNSIEALILLHKKIQNINDPYWKSIKSKEIESLITNCAGLFVESYTLQEEYVQNTPITIAQNLIVQQPNVDVKLIAINGQSLHETLAYNSTYHHEYSKTFPQITQPYWLRKPYTLGKFDVQQKDFGQPENIDAPTTTISLNINGLNIDISRPITYKYVSPVRGEIHQPIRIVPALTAAAPVQNILLPRNEKRDLLVSFTANGTAQNAQVINVIAPTGLHVTPAKVTLDFSKSSSIEQPFTLESTSETPQGQTITFSSASEGALLQKKIIEHEHIPTVSWFPALKINVQPIDINIPIKRVAYIPGAGDLIPQSLAQLGIQVELLTPEQINTPTLAAFDAVVFGVRAYNVKPELYTKHDALLQYVENGGTVLVQYNVNGTINGSKIGPYPFEITRARVTEENSPVNMVLPNDKALRYPNQITLHDFEGWVQERGLYFAENLDQHYRAPLAMNDKNEQPHTGSLIISDYGKGKFVYTSLSFFRQLPAGVPGAYRLFVNLLSKEDN